MINVEEKKSKIIEVIRGKGPSLPIQIAREIELSSLFTSAIMSEMISGKMLKTSSMKVGGSPLYYLDGQEPLLEKFSNYLGMKEKEVFLFIKEKGIVQDDLLNPAFRVAIRNLKDFAIPLKVNLNNEEKIFWRYQTIKMDDAVKKIREITKDKPKGSAEKKEKAERNEEIEKDTKHEKKAKPESTFQKDINEYILKSSIEIIREVESKKREAMKIGMMDSSIGKIQVLIIAKEKKNITENDLNLALSKGQEMRLPVLFLSTGKLNKKAALQIETFKSYLIFRQINS